MIRFSHPESGAFEVTLGSSSLVVGRKGGTADVLLDDHKASRKHARVWLEGGSVWYEDLQSTNGSWLEGRRIEGKLRMVPGMAVLLGKTSVTVEVDHKTREVVREGEMTLHMQEDARSLEGVFDARALLSARLTALCEIAQRLLEAPRLELMSDALERIFKAVPAAQRISLVAWPPETEGFRHLVGRLEREGVAGGPISRTLVAHSVTTRQALLFSDNQSTVEVVAASSLMGQDIRSAVYVPLVAADDEVMAVLCVDTPQPSMPFGPGDFQFIRAVGALLAAAMAAERLRERARAQELEARQMVAQREAMIAFLKIATHDLSNPLSVVGGAAFILGRAQDPGVRQEMVEDIHDAVRRARALILTYMEAAAVESGQALRIEAAALDPRQVVDEEIHFLERGLPAHAAKLRFHNEVEGAAVVADAQKFRQILGNLMSNAAKYSPAGGDIRIASSQAPGEVVFSVRDPGVGIAPEEQDRLFHQFERVGDRRLAEGSGLGLWLTQKLVLAHGGRIWVESTPGAGSTFFFTIPVS